jgi:hypothetical protein
VNDSRKAAGTVNLSLDTNTWQAVTPTITYTVNDTVDLRPGDCGSGLEQFATVVMSQLEATGIAGDVPFTVMFSARTTPFTL